jgi:hypothetical protein
VMIDPRSKPEISRELRALHERSTPFLRWRLA